MRKIGTAVVAAGMALLALPLVAAFAAAGATPEPNAGIWADESQWGTVGTPVIITERHALSFYDQLVYFNNSNTSGGQPPVAERAPGDTHYHGGNWVAFTATWTSAGFAHYGSAPLLESYAEVQGNVTAGYLSLVQGNPNAGGAAFFRCPLTGGPG